MFRTCVAFSSTRAWHTKAEQPLGLQWIALRFLCAQLGRGPAHLLLSAAAQVSVAHLCQSLLPAVEAAGLSRESKVYEIERPSCLGHLLEAKPD